ncbi:MAG: homogentisate phytyltransferase [Candidatus Promineofilum sp.]|nr:homogentisate phytyltransferase [Promineifilum sp.]
MALPKSVAPPAPTATFRLAILARFSRLHTVTATTVQVVCLYVMAAALSGAPHSPIRLLIAWLACLSANLYVVGLNQLTDVDIDRLNKPRLPLAHGDLSPGDGQAIVLAAGAAALLLAASQGPVLALTLGLVMLIGTAYSLPPLRLKARPVLAALSIALARGVIATLGVYVHFARGAAVPPLVAGAALFFFGFGLVIALFKDIPDRDGDLRHGVGTLAVRWGPQRVFQLGRALLTVLLLGLVAPLALRGSGMAALSVVHLALLLLFWLVSRRTDPAKPPSMMRLYFVLWGVFYAEYALFALTSVLGVL